MTDNQFNQLFDLVTKCVGGIQRLESDVSVLKADMSQVKADVAELKTDVAELKTDVAELKQGQSRIEKQVRLNNTVINELAGEQMRINVRVNELEKAPV